jgi:hypothetical protein
VEELFFEGVECGDIEVVNSYFLKGFDIGQAFFRLGRLTWLEFERWESWNTFVIREYDDFLRIEALGDGEFRITKLDTLETGQDTSTAGK